MNSPLNILGLDVGGRRIGVARVSAIAQIAEPLAVLENNSEFLEELKHFIAEHQIDTIVVGMPRNMQGEKTNQSEIVEKFAKETLEPIGLPIVFQDETLSTVMAEARSTLPKEMEDAVAACVILEDFVAESVGA